MLRRENPFQVSRFLKEFCWFSLWFRHLHNTRQSAPPSELSQLKEAQHFVRNQPKEGQRVTLLKLLLIYFNLVMNVKFLHHQRQSLMARKGNQILMRIINNQPINQPSSIFINQQSSMDLHQKDSTQKKSTTNSNRKFLIFLVFLVFLVLESISSEVSGAQTLDSIHNDYFWNGLFFQKYLKGRNEMNNSTRIWFKQ